VPQLQSVAALRIPALVCAVALFSIPHPQRRLECVRALALALAHQQRCCSRRQQPLRRRP
jgi:hypothetical protein